MMTHVTQEESDWAAHSVLRGLEEPKDCHILIPNLIRAIRDLKGVCRAEVAARMPWDVAYELMKLSFSVSTPDADPLHLDNDEDFQARLKTQR